MASYSELLADCFKATDIQSMKKTLDRIVMISCDEISLRKRDYKQRLYRTIKDYVDTHLTDREMYLPSMAEHFGMNPKYLTVFFRKNQGTPLAEYIRREHRILKSKQP